MALFTVVNKDSPDKVEGVLHKESSIERAKKAFMKPSNSDQAAAQAPVTSPQIDPAALAASNTPSASGQLSTEAFTAIRAKHQAEADAATPQTPNNEAEAQGTPPANPTSEATKPKEEETPLSPRYAHLARQEKAIRARDAQLKAEKVELQKAKEALAAREAELSSKYVPKERLSKETLAVLSELGIDYNAVTEQALEADPRDAEINALRAEIEAIKGAVDKTDQAFKDSQTQSYNQAKSMIRRDVSVLVNKDPNFETIKATESVDDVVELIEKTFNEGLDENYPKGTLISVEEAAQMVEDYLCDEAERLARLSKVQKRLQPKQDPKPPTQQPNSQQPQSKPTLTNVMTGAPKKEYTARQRAMFAAQYGVNWQEKVGDKAS